MRRALASESARYREVRGLSRGLSVLRALNAMPGGIGSVVELARTTGIHRTTVKRLLETLRAEGVVDHRDGGGDYALTFEVRRLAEGYVGGDWIDRIAAPAMRARLPRLSWPSDLATPDAGSMLVRESTHRQSLLSQHRATIGVRIPMLGSALGRAWLAWCDDESRDATLAMLRGRDDALGRAARDTRAVNRLLADTRRRGFALNLGELPTEADVAAIAFPILERGRAVAAINLVFVRDAVSLAQIRARHAPELGALAAEISAALSGDAEALSPPRSRRTRG